MPNNPPYTSASNPTGATAVPRAVLTNPYDANNHGTRVDHALVADSASAVAWSVITGKPSTFTPSAHTHPLSDIASTTSGKTRLVSTDGSGGAQELSSLARHATFEYDAAGETLIVIKNDNQAYDPAINSDASAGYAVNSQWVNNTTRKLFVCVDSTNGAAVWRDVSRGYSDGDLITATATQNAGDNNQYHRVSPLAATVITLPSTGNDLDQIAFNIANNSSHYSVTLERSDLSDMWVFHGSGFIEFLWRDGDWSLLHVSENFNGAKGDVTVGSGSGQSKRLAVGTNTHVLTADSAEATGLKWAAPAAAGVTDHGALTGLADDDHTQYHLTDGSRAMTGALTLPIGSAGVPSVNFGVADTGFYGQFLSDTLYAAHGGVSTHVWTATNFMPATTGAVDLGSLTYGFGDIWSDGRLRLGDSAGILGGAGTNKHLIYGSANGHLYHQDENDLTTDLTPGHVSAILEQQSFS